MLIMVTGVSGSGKSEYAKQISCQLAKDNKKYYVITNLTILATGEMGIGNTTTSTALACILLNLEPHMATGRGAGLEDKGLKKKIEVITRAKEMYGSCQDNPLGLLQNIILLFLTLLNLCNSCIYSLYKLFL